MLEPFGHVAAHDALRQTLHNGRLAHARLADEHRVVLGAPRQYLYDAPDFFVASDHRIQLPLRGQRREVAAVTLQGLVGGFGRGRGDALITAHFGQRLHQPLAGQAGFLQDPARGAAVLGGRKQEMLHRNVVVLQTLGLVFGTGEQALQTCRNVNLVRRCRAHAHLRQGVQDFGEAPVHQFRLDLRLDKQGRD